MSLDVAAAVTRNVAPRRTQSINRRPRQDLTGRFFRPRLSEDFYDNETDFDNVHNLIDEPEHRQKIAELEKALR